MSAVMHVLWAHGTGPERLGRLPAVRALAAAGVDARLVPAPLAEPTVCYYQTLTGMGPGKLGRFDSVSPVAYQAHAEADVPEGAARRLLPDLSRAGGPAIVLLESDVATADTLLDTTTAECVLVRLRDAATASDDALDTLVRAGAERVGAEGTLIVLSDALSPAPRRLVNVNSFLADAGLLETRPGTEASREINWDETLAYGLGTGQVWVNLRGREPRGSVGLGSEYDEVRAALIATLRDDWRDPETNEPVIARVLTKEEAFSGEYVFKAPDLVVTYQPGYAPSPRAAALEVEDVSVQPADAAPDATPDALAETQACLIGRGPALACAATASGRLIDVVPSLLYLLGSPIPAHVDGQVITDLFAPAYRERTPIVQSERDTAALTDEEESVIVSRLQALGYLG